MFFRSFLTRFALADPYKTLGLSRGATKKEAKTKYRQLAKKYHPDVAKGSDKVNAEKKFQEIQEAYEMIESGNIPSSSSSAQDPFNQQNPQGWGTRYSREQQEQMAEEQFRRFWQARQQQWKNTQQRHRQQYEQTQKAYREAQERQRSYEEQRNKEREWYKKTYGEYPDSHPNSNTNNPYQNMGGGFYRPTGTHPNSQWNRSSFRSWNFVFSPWDALRYMLMFYCTIMIFRFLSGSRTQQIVFDEKGRAFLLFPNGQGVPVPKYDDRMHPGYISLHDEEQQRLKQRDPTTGVYVNSAAKEYLRKDKKPSMGQLPQEKSSETSDDFRTVGSGGLNPIGDVKF